MYTVHERLRSNLKCTALQGRGDASQARHIGRKMTITIENGDEPLSPTIDGERFAGLDQLVVSVGPRVRIARPTLSECWSAVTEFLTGSVSLDQGGHLSRGGGGGLGRGNIGSDGRQRKCHVGN